MRFWSRQPSSNDHECAPADGRIIVDGGYSPREVVAAAGAPVQLTFHRLDSSRCSEEVVFPSLGIRAALPRHEDVDVELPVSEPGEYEFECGMGMLHGSVVVR